MGVIVGMERAVVKPAWMGEATADGKTVVFKTGYERCLNNRLFLVDSQ
jgi:hypothetical protein